MAAISEISFQCPNCTNWMPSAIQVVDDGLFDSAQMWGNTVGCPYCGQMVACGKANMRWRYADGQYGGYSGDDTRGPSPERAPVDVVPRTGNFQNETFRGQTFLLDACHFENCVFIGCSLHISGEGPGGTLSGCNLSQTRQPFRFVGPANNTLQFIATLYRTGGQQFVEGLFNDLRGQQVGVRR